MRVDPWLRSLPTSSGANRSAAVNVNDRSVTVGGSIGGFITAIISRPHTPVADYKLTLETSRVHVCVRVLPMHVNGMWQRAVWQKKVERKENSAQAWGRAVAALAAPTAMFGTPFGAPAPAQSPFGAPAPAAGGFGGFGSTSTPAFGQPATPFGAPSPAPGGFGAPAGGGFGAAPTGSLFGAASPFGAPAPTAGFGAPAPAAGFGASSSLFGGPAPAAAGGFGAGTPFGSGGSSGLAFGATPKPSMFGTPAPSFGAPAVGASNPFAPKTTSPFGVTASSSPFGAPAPAASPFGAPAPAFGAPAAPAFGAPGGGFGAPSTPSPFGAPASNAFGGGGFGPPAGVQKGTGVPPYRDTQERESTSGPGGQVQTFTYKSISKMPEYQNKSFEELRCEDYAKGNKGGSAPAAMPFGAATTSPFGAPAPAASPFGAAPASNPFAPKPATSPFGAPAAPTTSLFGAPAPSASPFGAAPTPSLFGAPAPAASPFGAAPAANPFAAKPASTPFGAPSPSPFGSSMPSSSPFGAPPASNPFAPKPAASPFGAPAPATNLFGGPLGGTTAPSPFGAPAPTSMFGAPAAAPQMNFFGAPPAGVPPPAGAPGVTMVQAPVTYVQLPPAPSTNPYPYGRHSLFAPAAAPAPAASAPGLALAATATATAGAPFLPPSLPASAGGGNGYSQSVVPRSVVNVRTPSARAPRHALPRQGELALAPPPSAARVTTCSISSSGGSERGNPRSSDSQAPFSPLVPFRPARVLNLDPSGLPPPEGLSGAPQASTPAPDADAPAQPETRPTPTTRPALTRASMPPVGSGSSDNRGGSSDNRAARPQPRRATAASEIPAPMLDEISRARMPQSAAEAEDPDSLPEDAPESETPPIAPAAADGANEATDAATPAAGALLSRPSRSELLRMTDEELSAVEAFEVSRPGLGSIVWPGLTDLRGLPTKLDSLVRFGPHEVVLYPNVPDELKPPPGQVRRIPACTTRTTFTENMRCTAHCPHAQHRRGCAVPQRAGRTQTAARGGEPRSSMQSACRSLHTQDTC